MGCQRINIQRAPLGPLVCLFFDTFWQPKIDPKSTENRVVAGCQRINIQRAPRGPLVCLFFGTFWPQKVSKNKHTSGPSGAHCMFILRDLVSGRPGGLIFRSRPPWRSTSLLLSAQDCTVCRLRICRRINSGGSPDPVENIGECLLLAAR